MSPTSYQGPRASDMKRVRTYTQNQASNLGRPDNHATVADILAEKGGDVFTVSPGDTVAKALGVLKDNRIGAVAVVGEGNDLRGILSERDIIATLDMDSTDWLGGTVKDVMTADPITCKPDEVLLSVLRTMTDGNFRHMPVVDGDGKMVGLISIRDVVRKRLSELEYEALRLKQMIVG
ncbi:CBS domain-containing protein [Fluviibacterium sp. DFM31]|uniref:CBS domain-containing protein n=1 Tax=Meridianimarinicoccus marinus TaxID=3231483 RepID=A0ABV3L481_9RHOB